MSRTPESQVLARINTRAERERIRKAQEVEMEAALLAWLQMQSSENSHRLYNAGIAYFGIEPVIPD